MIVTFTGTVVDCRTRFNVQKPTTAFLTHFDANWILTVAIEQADEGAPVVAGSEKSFAIHSPVQVTYDSAEECVGKRYTFSVEIDDSTKRPQWATFRRA
jgi:hypothetical protein